MQHFGIIGKPLGHSQSKTYFDKLFREQHIDADYKVYEIASIEEVKPLLDRLDGLNVTSPYKESVMAYLDAVDDTAREIGAVNVIYHKHGYNTDWLGAMAALKSYLRPIDKQALVLGTGGAARAVRFAIQQMGIHVLTVSRQAGKGDLTYADLTAEIIRSHTVIANCTPLGMRPLDNQMPCLPYDQLTSKHLLFDCIYNPEKTPFLALGEQQRAMIVNGYEMFLAQANEAKKIFRI